MRYKRTIHNCDADFRVLAVRSIQSIVEYLSGHVIIKKHWPVGINFN
jgi:hypothetical protein